jgi:regulatory protein
VDTFEKLYNKTLHFLSFRPRSEKEIKDYLRKKKADDLTVKRIIDNLRQNKFINDLEFAKWWIEQRTKIKPRSNRVIKFELLQKGISKELVEELIRASDLTEFDRALDLANKKIKKYEKLEKNKAYEIIVRFLSSKGFEWDIIKEVIDRVLIK